MNWILENFTHESSYDEMIVEIKKQGMNLKIIKEGYKHSDLDEFRSGNQCIMFLGSIGMTEIVKKQLPNCFPVAYCTIENYLCTRYMSHFGKYLFNDRYSILSLAELQRQKFFFYGLYGKEAMIFIRPDSGQKPFQARLMDLLDFDEFVKSESDRIHQLVVVSTPKTIIWEGRFITSRDKEIISYSTYRFQGQVTKISSVPPESLNLCQELLEVGYYPDTIFCLDLCQDSDGNFWLLEINSFSSAGMYAANKQKIVKRVSEIAEQEFSKNY